MGPHGQAPGRRLTLLALPVVLLAQAGDFVTFEVCRVTYDKTPWGIASPADEEPFDLRPGQVGFIQPLPHSVAGLRCTRVCSQVSCRFVIGTRQEVRDRLRAAEK